MKGRTREVPLSLLSQQPYTLIAGQNGPRFLFVQLSSRPAGPADENIRDLGNQYVIVPKPEVNDAADVLSEEEDVGRY